MPHTSLLFLVLLYAALEGGRPETRSQDLTGTWSASVEAGGGRTWSSLNLRQLGTRLDGSVSGRQGGSHTVTGNVAGDSVRLSFSFVETTPERPMTVTAVRISSDSLHGRVTFNGRDLGDFFAVRDR